MTRGFYCFGFLLAWFWFFGNESLYAQQTVAPEKVVGRQSCAQCHGQELKAWELSSHNTKAWSQLEHIKAAEFADAIGVTDIKGDSSCTQCHGTHQKINSQLMVLPGNSCESCHGGAGGHEGWLTGHYDFGLGRTVDANTKMADLLADRLREAPEHRLQRDKACDEKGMIRSDNPVAIARNCLNCHLLADETLFKAGHPMSTKFELVEWASGEVRHNFLLDPKLNSPIPTNWQDEFRNGPGRTVTGRKRLMYVAGKLADLEVSLRARASVTSTRRGTLGDEMNDRILDIQEELEELDIDSLNPVLKTLKGVKKRTLKSITDGDQELYAGIADAVAAAADAFIVADRSGNNLPDTIRIRDKTIGEPYRSN